MLRLAVLTRLVTDTDCLMNSSMNAHVSLLQNTKKRKPRFFGILKYVCDIVVKIFTFVISSSDEFSLTFRRLYLANGAR